MRCSEYGGFAPGVLVFSCCLFVAATGFAEPGLIAAVKKQDRVATRALIAGDVNVNAPQADGATALHWAVHRDDLETVQLLLEAGADASVANDFGVMPLALASANRNATIAEALLKAGADASARLMSGESVLMTAAHAGDLATVETLAEHGADLDATEPVRNQTALMWAIGERHAEVALTLIARGADIHSTTTLGFTPLLFACREGVLDVAEALLDAGADVNTIAHELESQTYLTNRAGDEVVSEEGLSALHVATLRGQVDVATMLLRRGADPNYDGPGYTALHWAVGSWETELNGINGMRAPQSHEWHRMSGVKAGKHELIKALLKYGADPNARLEKNPSRFGFTVASTRPKRSTPYVLAARAGDAEAMRILVKNGADPTLRPAGGVPPLLWASGVGRHRAENIASEDASLEAVKAALEHGADVNQTDSGGNTAMHGAAWIRSTKMVEFLIDQGGEVNVKNKSGHTPLFVAERDGRFAGIGGPLVLDSPIANLLRGLTDPKLIAKASN